MLINDFLLTCCELEGHIWCLIRQCDDLSAKQQTLLLQNTYIPKKTCDAITQGQIPNLNLTHAIFTPKNAYDAQWKRNIYF